MTSVRDPIFSIIVPVYNMANFLSKCLASIANQTLVDIEVIIVDDGSTDASLSICREFAESHKNFQVHTKKNEGQGVARNYGLALARGEYVCYVDSDDWIDPELCADMRAILERTSADFVNFGLDYVTLSGGVVKRFDRFSAREVVGAQIFHLALLDDQVKSSPCNKVYRRRFLIDNGIQFPPLRANEDVYYSRAISRAARKTAFVSKVYYHALVRPGSTTRKMSIANFLEAEQLMRVEYEQFLSDNADPLVPTLFRAHVAKFFSYLLIQAAFLMEQPAEYVSCFDVARRCSLFDYGRDLEVMRKLRLKNRLMVKLCNYPGMLRVLANMLRRIGVAPY